MKIYEIGTGYTPIPAKISAATEIVVEELTKAMQKQGLPVEIVDIASESRGQTQLPIREVPVPKQFSGTDVQLGIMHKLKRVVYSVALAGELKKILRTAEEKVVLHFHNQYNLFFFLQLTPAKLREKCLIAYTNHSGIWRLDWAQIEGTIRKRYFQEAACMKKANLVFLLNEETKRNVMEHLGVSQERIVLIGNGVNTDVYCPLPAEEKAAVKEKFGLSGCRVILQVGSVYENKGQLRAVQYLLPLLKANPDVVYAYAGGIVDEEYQKQISLFAQENGLTGQVRYLGMVSPGGELNELYNTANVTILPSRYEAFGLVAIESLSAGVPVLVDRMGPIRFGGGSVRYDPECFEETAGYLVYNVESELCEAARRNAVKHFSWEKIAADYTAAFMDRMG